MKRILILADIAANKLGSHEELCIFIARELLRKGFICYLGFSCEPSPEMRSLFESEKAVVVDIFKSFNSISKNRTASGLAMAAALWRFIIREKIDLVEINFFGLTTPCLLGLYISNAVIIYNDRTSSSAPVRGPIKYVLSSIIHAYFSRRIAKYVAVSYFTLERMLVSHHISPDKALVVHNGINLERFKPQDKTIARRNCGLPENAKIVVSAGALIPEKGIGFLIEAAAIIIEEAGVKDLLIVIVGEGPCRQALEKSAFELGIANHVIFTGRRSDVDQMVAASDVVVVPSLWAEAFGLITAEAMASGRPVVGSRVGATPELLDNGNCGILVEPGDSRALAKGVATLLREPELGEKLAARALERSKRLFNLKIQAAANVDIFEDLLKAHA